MGLGWERAVRGLVGGLIVAPSRDEQEQGGGGKEAAAAKPGTAAVVRQAGKRSVVAGLKLLMCRPSWTSGSSWS
eukprot:800349-Prymnesium_polylepis.1